jgi:pyruvate-formate lyase
MADEFTEGFQDKKTGRLSGSKKGRAIIPSPTQPGRDIHGRALPGYSPIYMYSERLQKLKLALLDSVTAEQVQAVINELREICMDREHPHQLSAIALFLNQVIGKPAQHVLVDKQTTHQVKIDYSKLPTEKLLQLQNILQDTPTVIVQDAQVTTPVEEDGKEAG